jgi:hypothetical protein
MFPKATGYFGPGTFAHCTPGQFHDEPYSAGGIWDANFFHPDLATEKCEELTGEWQPFGPFDKALDFLGDGSLWVIQAPGHMVGNLAAAARLANGEWVILGSDCCHSKWENVSCHLSWKKTTNTPERSRALLDGTADFRVWKSPQGEEQSLHEDLGAVRTTVQKIKAFELNYGAHVALAHDSSWMLAGTDDVLMSLLDDDLREFAKTKLPIDGDPWNNRWRSLPVIE